MNSNLLKQIRHNKIAVLAIIILLILYISSILAGFLSPYSPTEDEFREYFYHPPKLFHFVDQEHNFHLRPFVYPIFIVDRTKNIYSEGRPLCILINKPEFNQDNFFPDSITTIKYSPILIKNTNKKLIGTITELIETEPNSGTFHGCYPSSPYDFQNKKNYIIEFRNPMTNELISYLKFKTSSNKQLKQNINTQVITLIDENKVPIETYYYKIKLYPLNFFSKGFEYRLLFRHKIHLFKPQADGKIFLFGTDQSGRDIFSRTLYGARISLTIGIVGAVISSILGLLLGSVAGYYGKNVDSLIMRIVEILMSIPTIYLILALRSMVPNEFGDLYNEINLLAAQIYCWKNNISLLFFIIFVALYTIYYLFRIVKKKQISKSKYFTLIILLFALYEGNKIIHLLISILAKIIPPETTISTKWTYFYVVIIISLIGWASMARLIRGVVLSIKEQDYVNAAKALGGSNLYIIRRHILPATYRYVIIRANLMIPFFILSEIALSYLGLGIQEPEPSWGNMLQYAQNVKVLTSYPWMLIPGFFIFISILSFNFIGDTLSSMNNIKSYAIK